MGCRNGYELPYGGEEEEEAEAEAESSFSDALLFATICIIGLPADVHARDGSVYSGIFHTASAHGVVLKKAKMTKNGRSISNVAIGTVVETLVILSSELVQVVAKGVLLPADGASGTIAGDELETALGTPASDCAEKTRNKGNASSTMTKKRIYQKRTSVQTENGFTHGDSNTSKSSLPRVNGNEGQWVLKHDMRCTKEEHNNGKGARAVDDKVEDVSVPVISESQIKDDKILEIDDAHKASELSKRTNMAEVNKSSSRDAQRIPSVKPGEEGRAMLMHAEHPDGVSVDPAPALVRSDEESASADNILNNVSSCLSRSSSPQADVASQACLSLQSNGPEKTKEFKLNPGAKLFSPTCNSSRSTTPPLAQTATCVTYMPSTSPMLPAQTDVGISPFLPHSNVPVKALPYSGIGDIDVHPEPVPRPQLLRYAGQHQTVPVGSNFVHPSSQPLMMGRMGQVMYMPLPQDLVQNGAAISPVFPRSLPNVNQVLFPKHQGNFPGQPFIHSPITGAQQVFASPSPMSLMQPPFIANRPVVIPGPNGLYPAKFS